MERHTHTPTLSLKPGDGGLGTCAFTEGARFAAALLFLGLAWLVIPLQHPGPVAGWLDNETLPHAGVWILALSAIAVVMRRSLLAPPNQRWRAGGILAGTALLCTVWLQPLPAYVGHYVYLTAFTACMYGIGGSGWLRVVGPAVGLLACLPGLPPAVQQWVVGCLQEFGTFVTVSFCRWFLSAAAVADGGSMVFLHPDSESFIRVGVGPECSGYRSLFGLLLLSLFCCAHPRLLLRSKFFLLATAASLAVSVNLLRLTVSVSLYHYGLSHLADGLAHSALGQALMLLEAVLLYFMWKRLLKKSPRCSGSEECDHEA